LTSVSERLTSDLLQQPGIRIVKGSAYEPTPWRAVQWAAWEAVNAI
jgi:hypothetical protein